MKSDTTGIYQILEQYSKNFLFFEIQKFILSDKQLQFFLLNLDKTYKSTKELNSYFNTEKSLYNEDLKCSLWDEFLKKHSFEKDRKMFLHDLIGHVALNNNITSKGEILATSGMCGFSFELGKYYFINALLIFSLEYNLFDGTRSDKFDISQYIHEINLSYERGKLLRNFLEFDESILNIISIEEFLVKNCEKLKGFKV